jgi:hypothetical protein
MLPNNAFQKEMLSNQEMPDKMKESFETGGEI